MKTRRLHFLVVLLAALSLGAAAAAPAAKPAAKDTAEAPGPQDALKPPPLSPRFQQVRNRIEALFASRNSHPAPLDPRHNPFRPAGPFVAPPAETSDGRPGATAPEPAATEETTLQEVIAALKLGGRFEVGGREHRMINGRLYKEGDVIPIQAGIQTIYLRVKALTQKTVTLSLNGVDATVPL